MYLNVDYVNLILDADLSMIRIVPASGHEDVALTIMGSHTLTLNSYEDDTDKWDSTNPPITLQAGNLVIEKSAVVNARGLWYAVWAKNDIIINNATVKAAAANEDIRSSTGSVYIKGENTVVDCTFKDGSNGLISSKDLVIEDGIVSAFGISSAIRGFDTVRINGGKVTAEGRYQGIQAEYAITIAGGSVNAKNTGEYTETELKDRSAAITTGGLVTVSGGTVTATGKHTGIRSKNTIRILGGSVTSTGTVSALSSGLPIEFGDGIGVLKPGGGKVGKTSWSTTLKYGIVDYSAATAKYVKIGLIPAAVSQTITPEDPVRDDTIEKNALSIKGEKDLKGSSFALLQAKGTARSKKEITLTWNKVPGATQYVIYGNPCGKKKAYRKLASVTENSWSYKNCKKGTYYKFIVAAVDSGRTLSLSKTVHVAAKGGSWGNCRKVVLSKKSLKVKKGKTQTIKATMKGDGKQIKNHRKIAFESDDPTIAKVSSKGKIKAIKEGTCNIYVYAQNGVFARVKVTVKG